MRKSSIRILVTAAAAMAQAACSSMQVSAETFSVAVSNLTYLGASDEGQRYLVALEVTNLGDGPIEMRGLGVNIRITGEGYLDGESNDRLTVPANGESRLTLELQSQIMSSISRLTSYLQGPESTLPYVISGMLVLDTRPPRIVDFEYSGRTPLSMQSGN